MSHQVINAVSRGSATKGELRTKRIEGSIPAVSYGSGKAARSIYINESEFLAAISSITESTIIDLVIDGTPVQAFVKARQRASVTHRIIHVDFLEITSGQLLHARVPLQLVGSAPGVREGGILENPCHEIEVVCDPSVLPERILVDVSGLRVNHSIHLRDVAIPEGVKVLSNADQVIVAVKYLRGEQVEAEAAPAAAAATPAAAAAPAAAPAEKKAEKK